MWPDFNYFVNVILFFSFSCRSDYILVEYKKLDANLNLVFRFCQFILVSFAV
jgi:hypothetical protein